MTDDDTTEPAKPNLPPKLNRAQRRARNIANTPDMCAECIEYWVDHEDRVRAACAPVALELGVMPDTAVAMFMQGFHDGGHDPHPEVAPENQLGAGPSQN